MGLKHPFPSYNSNHEMHHRNIHQLSNLAESSFKHALIRVTCFMEGSYEIKGE